MCGAMVNCFDIRLWAFQGSNTNIAGAIKVNSVVSLTERLPMKHRKSDMIKDLYTYTSEKNVSPIISFRCY